MKKIITILSIVLLLASINVRAQLNTNTGDVDAGHHIEFLSLFLDTLHETTRDKGLSISDFEAFVEKLKNKRTRIKNDQRFFNYLFYKTHRKYLKQYQMHSSVEDILRSGAYDCVSGTAFYALIMHHLGIDYEIKEFDFHVLVIARSNNQEFLIESTDPAGGLTRDPEEIADRIKQYLNAENKTDNILSVSSGNKTYQYSSTTNNSINLIKLAGLLHFNNAVYYYNQKKPFKAVSSLQKSLALYDSKRIRAFQRLAARSFLGDPNLTQIQKEELIDKLGLELVALK